MCKPPVVTKAEELDRGRRRSFGTRAEEAFILPLREEEKL